MLMTIAVVLAILWLLGLVAIHISTPVFHIILLVALVIFIYDLVTRGRAV